MTRTLHVCGRHAHVKASVITVLALKLLELFFHLVLHCVFQLIELHAHLLTQLGSHILEVGEQSGDDTLLAQISDAEAFQGVLAVGLEVAHLG